MKFRYSVRDAQSRVTKFKEEIARATSKEELAAIKCTLELYIRAIEKEMEGMPLSSQSEKLIRAYHQMTYKYD